MRKFMILISIGYVLSASSLYASPIEECGKALTNVRTHEPTLYDAKMCELGCKDLFKESSSTGNRRTAEMAAKACFFSANYYELNNDYRSANDVIAYLSSKGYSLEEVISMMKRS